MDNAAWGRENPVTIRVEICYREGTHQCDAATVTDSLHVAAPCRGRYRCCPSLEAAIFRAVHEGESGNANA